MYALNYDTEGKFFKIFKLANNEEFDMLSCEDIALIEKRLDMSRKPKESDIKAIIKDLIKEEG
jgi:hypothetical protein